MIIELKEEDLIETIEKWVRKNFTVAEGKTVRVTSSSYSSLGAKVFIEAVEEKEAA